MLKFNRAERRAQVARLKVKRKFYWSYGRAYGTEGNTSMNPRQLGMVVQHPQSCSCPMGCGNARKVYGRPFRELIHQINLEEELAMLRH